MGKDQRTTTFGVAGVLAGAVAGVVGDWLRLQQRLWALGVRPELWIAAGRDGVEGPRRTEARS